MCDLRSGQPDALAANYCKPDRIPNPNPNPNLNPDPSPNPNRNSHQVGHSLQLFVYNTQPSAPMKKMREAVVINPKILDYGERAALFYIPKAGRRTVSHGHIPSRPPFAPCAGERDGVDLDSWSDVQTLTLTPTLSLSLSLTISLTLSLTLTCGRRSR